jgi:3-phosphoshikimate 1-carboxyvinyltransferase
MHNSNESQRVLSAEFKNKTVLIPTSKSQANRMLVLAALSKNKVRLNNLPDGNDVRKMLSALAQIGLKLEYINRDVIIHNSFPACEKDDPRPEIILQTGDGGTTNRFLMAMLGLGSKSYVLDAEGPMRARPMEELESTLKDLGVSCERGKTFWYKVRGPYKTNKARVTVDAARSTQFASAMAMALSPLDIPISVINLEASENYYRMTEDLIQKFKSGENEFNVPVDGSSLSYPLALAALNGSVRIPNMLAVDPLQADFALMEILKDMGLEWSIDAAGLSLKGKKELPPLNHGQVLECNFFPDLVPTLIFLASYCNGQTLLKNIKVLRHKESDRIEECLKLLKQFNIGHHYDESADILSIEGNATKQGQHVIHCPADHRIVMVGYLFLRFNSGGELLNIEHVKKSFPDFFQQME